MYCIGCEGYFCNKCFRKHRETMFGQMDDIIESRNQLQEVINTSVKLDDQQSPVIEEINNWEKITIEKVKKAAAEARQQAVQSLNAGRIKIHNEFKTFSQQLAGLQESEDYVEHDLERLNKLIGQFKLDVEQSTQPTTIKLHTEQGDQINWKSLIYIEEVRTTTSSGNQQPTARKFSIFRSISQGTYSFA